jgi:hypothetical protein
MNPTFPPPGAGPSRGFRTGTLLALLLVTLAGCQEEGIHSYTVPKEPLRRTLGVILPHQDAAWFFKLTGRRQAVEQQEKDFLDFVHSVRFAEDGRPKWVVPAGWTEEEGEGMRYRTFRAMADSGPVLLTVTRLGRGGGGLLANVNRWRKQLGLPAIGEVELEKQTEKIQVGGLEATLVDLIEQRSDGPSALPPMHPMPPLAAHARGKLPFSHAAPKSWKSRPPSPVQTAVWAIGGKDGVEVSVTSLRGTGGGLLPNVNRWRGQLGLGPVKEAKLKNDVGTLTVGGEKCSYIDITGPAGKGQQRLLVVLIPHAGQTWFFKAKGPAALVKEHKAAFEKFVRSVKFDGGQGAADE